MQSRRADSQQEASIERSATTDPGKLGANLMPVATGVRAESGSGLGSRADAYAARLQKVGLFTVRIRDAQVERGSYSGTS